jgi:GH18 family chitinase
VTIPNGDWNKKEKSQLPIRNSGYFVEWGIYARNFFLSDLNN